MYLELRIFLQAFILENQIFIRFNIFDLSSPWGVWNGFAIFLKLFNVILLRYCNSWQVGPISKISFLDNKIKYV